MTYEPRENPKWRGGRPLTDLEDWELMDAHMQTSRIQAELIREQARRGLFSSGDRQKQAAKTLREKQQAGEKA
jgi:hypothetical protein